MLIEIPFLALVGDDDDDDDEEEPSDRERICWQPRPLPRLCTTCVQEHQQQQNPSHEDAAGAGDALQELLLMWDHPPEERLSLPANGQDQPGWNPKDDQYTRDSL